MLMLFQGSLDSWLSEERIKVTSVDGMTKQVCVVSGGRGLESYFRGLNQS